MTPDTFFDLFVDSVFCDVRTRPKTTKALMTLCQRVPDETINEWPRIVVFAPDPSLYGSCVGLKPSDLESDDAFIYLSPSLERHSQAEVDFSVAHEFAHAALRHHLAENMTLSTEEVKKGYLGWNSEVAADKLVEDWGFTIPKRRKRRR